MYINFLNDRRELGYEAVKDTNDGEKLVVISDSTVLLVRKVSKRIILILVLGSAVRLNNIESAEAMIAPTPMLRVQIDSKNTYKTKVVPIITPKKK